MKGPEGEVDVSSSSGASGDKSWSGMRRRSEGDPHASECNGSEPDTVRAGLGKRDPGNGECQTVPLYIGGHYRDNDFDAVGIWIPDVL